MKEEFKVRFKKILFLTVLIFLTLSLVACSPKAKNGANVKVTEENVNYLSEYEQTLQEKLEELSEILGTFNNSLDAIYTREITNTDFANILKELISQSNTLVTSIDNLDIHPELFEANQSLTNLVNRSHQLLLEAVDQANKGDENEINKDSLRKEYLEIKNEQAALTNQWKIFRQNLEKGSAD